MTALGVVEHLRNLAADPQNRATIVKVRDKTLMCMILRRPCLFCHLALNDINGFLIFYRIKVA